jgi:hypothetical protein
MLEWYALRWKVELFHKILKSGCRAGESKLRTAERLANLLSIYCIVSWRIFWLTMLNRVVPDVSPHLALTGLEMGLLDELVRDKGHVMLRSKTLSYYLVGPEQCGLIRRRLGSRVRGQYPIVRMRWSGLP